MPFFNTRWSKHSDCLVVCDKAVCCQFAHQLRVYRRLKRKIKDIHVALIQFGRQFSYVAYSPTCLAGSKASLLILPAVECRRTGL
jgi:hypothetical protein